MTDVAIRTAPFVNQLAEIASELRRGRSVLVECDKILASHFVIDLKERLQPFDIAVTVIDGRAKADEPGWNDWTLQAIMVAQLRKALRSDGASRVVAIPHLDVLCAAAGGLVQVAREMILLLYELPERVFLGFVDPTLPALPIVARRFDMRLAMIGSATSVAVPQPLTTSLTDSTD